jgi:DNA-binding transcriptional ArsR family regulator
VWKTTKRGNAGKSSEGRLSQPKKDRMFRWEDRLDAVAFVAKSLSDENRLRILLSISKDKKAVSRIVEELQLSQPLVSHHLKELKRALLVNVERDGPFVYYELADPRIVGILENLGVIAADLLSNRTTF